MGASFTIGGGYRVVNASLVNEVAIMWARAERGIDLVKDGSDQGRDVYPA